MADAASQLRTLREQVAYHERRYRLDHAPEISDQAFDALVRELAALRMIELRRRFAGAA